MRFFRKVVEYFGFTKTETRVILFILGAFLIGAGIKLYEFYFHSPGESDPVFDYTESDRDFQQRASGLLKSAPSAQPEGAAVDQGTRSQPQERSQPKARPALHSININNASKDELISLPGIGEALAERIILFREDIGLFTTIQELKNVRGIGDKKFEHLRPYITLE